MTERAGRAFRTAWGDAVRWRSDTPPHAGGGVAEGECVRAAIARRRRGARLAEERGVRLGAAAGGGEEEGVARISGAGVGGHEGGWPLVEEVVE